MLQSLSLKNFAIVGALELKFGEGFSVLTGETGAGKSILLNALFFLLGERADYSQIKEGEEEAQLSAVFAIHRLESVREFLRAHGFDADNDELYIKRIMSGTGKSRSFINGEPITLTQLKELGSLLVAIHGQNTQQELVSDARQRDLLDAYAGNQKLAQKTASLFLSWLTAKRRLREAELDAASRQNELERLLWQDKELSELNPRAGEWEELSREYDELSHSQELKEVALGLEGAINSDGGLQEQLAHWQSELSSLAHLAPVLEESLAILRSVETELSEVALTMRGMFAHAELNPEELALMEKRLADLSAYAKKYQVAPEALPAAWEAEREALARLQEEQDLEKLQRMVQEKESEYFRAARELTQKREAGAGRLGEEVTKIARALSLSHAEMIVRLTDTSPGKNGTEKIEFLVALNPGSGFHPLSKVASGGELSRLSLALEVVVSAYNETPTLIFDEVDSGIGGAVADTVGHYLQELAKHKQIFAITHLPQVAVYGAQHYLISKTATEKATKTEAALLSPEAREEEIARMLGGEKITPLTRSHAAELLALAAKS